MCLVLEFSASVGSLFSITRPPFFSEGLKSPPSFHSPLPLPYVIVIGGRAKRYSAPMAESK